MTARMAALLAALIALPAHADGVRHPTPEMHGATAHEGLAVRDAWVRAAPPSSKVGAAYFTLENAGGSPETLTGAATNVAERVELHDHVMDGDRMRMREIEGGVALEPGETVAFAPGGKHVMLIDLTEPLDDGGMVPLVLEFESGRTIMLEVPIQRRAPQGGEAGHGHGQTQ